MGVIAEPVGALAGRMYATAGKPITPIAEIMSQWSQVYRNIYRINKTRSPAVSLGCLISWKPLAFFCGGKGSVDGGGKEEQGKPATRNAKCEKRNDWACCCSSTVSRESIGNQTHVIIDPKEEADGLLPSTSDMGPKDFD